MREAAPAAPSVTVGASNIKQLQFDWDPVPQANYYELWFKANDGAQWVKYADTPGRTLAVGAAGDASTATGIGGDQTNASAPERGAAWVY